MSDFDVIIAGGGPVGMGLAIELGQRGIRVAVIERHHQPQPIPKGQNLTQRTAEHFLAWGCEAELRTAFPLPPGSGIGGLTTYGTLLSEHHYDWLNRAHVRDFYRCANARLPQYATEGVLRDRAAQIADITLLYGWSVIGFSQDSNDLQVEIEATSDGARQVLTGRYAVGCDGSRSLLRAAAGIEETLADHNRVMALLVFRSPELHELLKRYPGKAFYNVLHPDFEGYWQFFGRVDHGVSWFFHAPVPLGTTRESHDFEAMLTRAVGQPFALELDYVGLWDLRVAIADDYRKGRAFVAGDAAHSHPPYGGYGINTGFEDARNLGWKLAAVIQGWGDERLLDSYNAERRPVFASTARDFIERFITDDRAFLETYNPERDRAAFEAAWHSRNLDADEVMAFEPHYEGSPLIGGAGSPSAKGSHTHTARPGHHVSPRDLPDGTNSFDRLGAGFTLLAEDVARAADFVNAAKMLGVPLALVDVPEGALETAYGSSAVLVRPDHFVAWIEDGAEAGAVLRRATAKGV
ncbi:FAD-dependent monooxygenase [Roseicyclus sp.]|uniref:FAD-dependent monooxygenase n=1 Tax=Roseicyclus sp. TaxID=1914329 RepID=UPI003F6BFE8D